MDNMKILLTGGSGRVGTELQKIRKFEYVPTHVEMDITDEKSVLEYTKNKTIDLIVHCAALPNTNSNLISEKDIYNVNVRGTGNILDIAPIIFISTEYVFDGKKGNYKEFHKTNPVNYYGVSKILGEELILDNCGVVLRIGRMSLNPWPYEYACIDMFTSGDYIDVISKEINLAINLFDSLPDIIHIGTTKKNIFDLALKTKKDVKPIQRSELDSILPEDCSFNTNLWESIKNKNLLYLGSY